MKKLKVFVLGLVGISIALAATFPSPVSLDDSLKGKTPSEKADMKADAIIKDNIPDTFDFTDQKLHVEIKKIEKIEGGIQVFARAWIKDQPVGLGIDGRTETERFRISNPPVLVPDGKGKIQRESFDQKTGQMEVYSYREDPRGALELILAHAIFITGKTNAIIISGSVGHTTDIYFPNPSVETTSTDGYVYRGTSSTFATQRAASAGTVADHTATTGYMGCLEANSSSTDQWDFLCRGFTLFDSSPLPDTDTVSAVTLSIAGSSKNIDYASSLVPVAVTPASNTTLGVNDYNISNFGTVEFASRLAGSSYSTSGYNDFALNASGIAAVSKTGITKFGWRTSYDMDNAPPTWSAGKFDEYKAFMADSAGTSQDPMLTIVHSSPASGVRAVMLF